jgi:hypothetical protein
LKKNTFCTLNSKPYINGLSQSKKKLSRSKHVTQ